MTHTITISTDELTDIIIQLGGRLTDRKLGGYGAKDRLALRDRLEDIEREGNAPLASHPVYGEE